MDGSRGRGMMRCQDCAVLETEAVELEKKGVLA